MLFWLYKQKRQKKIVVNDLQGYRIIGLQKLASFHRTTVYYSSHSNNRETIFFKIYLWCFL